LRLVKNDNLADHGISALQSFISKMMNVLNERRGPSDLRFVRDANPRLPGTLERVLGQRLPQA
jgi:hypothetical protein